MTSKRDLEKRLERLEAEREMKRRRKADRFNGEIDEAEGEAVIEFARHRLRDPDAIPAEVVASFPTGLQEQFGLVDSGSEK